MPFLTYVRAPKCLAFETTMGGLVQLRSQKFIQGFKWSDTHQFGIDAELYPDTSAAVRERGGHDEYVRILDMQMMAIGLDPVHESKAVTRPKLGTPLKKVNKLAEKEAGQE